MLLSPLRKRRVNPAGLVRPYICKGMTVLDLGCAMGFFSLPMAELAGPAGRVICVDLQKRMIAGLERRARKGVCSIVSTRGYALRVRSCWVTSPAGSILRSPSAWCTRFPTGNRFSARSTGRSFEEAGCSSRSLKFRCRRKGFVKRLTPRSGKDLPLSVSGLLTEADARSL